ncbi:unnamed protein product, partial [Ectocarpus sp. 6 AP-2014]
SSLVRRLSLCLRRESTGSVPWDKNVENHSSAAPCPPDTALAATKREPSTMDASTISPSLSQGDNNPERNRLRPTLSRMRRSCSECGRKKRSCDGQRPCGRCVASGSHCTYTERRRHGHQPRSQQDQHRWPYRDRVNVKEALLHDTTGALMSPSMLTLKR